MLALLSHALSPAGRACCYHYWREASDRANQQLKTVRMLGAASSELLLTQRWDQDQESCFTSIPCQVPNNIWIIPALDLPHDSSLPLYINPTLRPTPASVRSSSPSLTRNRSGTFFVLSPFALCLPSQHKANLGLPTRHLLSTFSLLPQLIFINQLYQLH